MPNDTELLMGSLAALTEQIKAGTALTQASAAATQAQLGQVLERLEDVRSSVGNQAVIVGGLQASVANMSASLERNWQTTSELEARLRAVEQRPPLPPDFEARVREVEKTAVITKTQLVIFGAVCSLIGGALATGFADALFHVK